MMIITILIKSITLVLLFGSLLSLAKFKETDDFPTEETVNYILEITKTIETCVLNPTEENGGILLKSLYEYYNNLDDLYWMMKEKDRATKLKAYDLVRKIIDNGEPVVLVEEINFDKLKVKFEWNDRSVQEIYDVIKEIKSLWENVEFLYNELGFDDFDFVTGLPPDFSAVTGHAPDINMTGTNELDVVINHPHNCK